MTDSPCDFSIIRHTASGEIDCVRIQCVDHHKVLVRIDMSLTDLAAALLGAPVIAAITLDPQS